MMFELKHSRVSVISYQVHTCDATIQQNCCTLFRKTLKKLKLSYERTFCPISCYIYKKNLASNLTHDIFVLLCKIIFLTHFSAFTHFFKKIILHINIFGRMTTNPEDYLANLEALSSLAFLVLFCIWSSQQLCIEGPLPVSNFFFQICIIVSPTSIFKNKVDLWL